jgi:4-amino-4-deoxy-L-arabinose transferase-like glycosyltransferase
LILVVALFLRFYQLDGSSLWSDEGNSWAMLSRSLAQIAGDAAADIHPPGYYWLLKGWTALFGRTAFGMRSFSAVAGLLLVWVIYQLARTLASNPRRPGGPAMALLAAWLAALNPLQVYYSQEARMYLLLALAGSGLVWATLRLLNPTHPAPPVQPAVADARARPALWWPALVYVVCGATGLWTHYSFPIVLAAAVAGFGLTTWRSRAQRDWRTLRLFILLNLVVLLLFVPWLPTAIERVRAWPQGGVNVGWRAGAALTLRTLLFGPLRNVPSPLWPWLCVAALLPLGGLWAIRRQRGMLVVLFWLLAPIMLMFGLGLFSEAFLKFLLVASPAWCVAVAGLAVTGDTPTHRPRRFGFPLTASLVVAGGAAFVAGFVLPAYYFDPAARDNYAGVAAYLRVVGNPADSLVVLDAPGQQEVWAYYDPGIPVLALPQQRPPERTATLATLVEAVKHRRQIFALFWATAEADPEQLVEHWLDQQAFKGLESWQGNLRFVTYTLPGELACHDLTPAPQFGSAISLIASCAPPSPAPVAPGGVLPVGLRWSTDQPLSERYKVTVQLLNSRNQVVAQRDSEPVGGTQPTNRWTPGETVVDNHGLVIPFGTPPGDYRLLVALYDPISGQRLPTPTGDAFQLDDVTLLQAEGVVPLTIIPMTYRVERRLGPVKLAGYDRYRTGFAHAPQTAVAPGDPVHFTFYWQAPNPLPPDWPADQHFTLHLGTETVTASLAGGAYPTSRWRPGEVVRGEFDLRYDGTSEPPTLVIGDGQIRLATLPR